MTINLTKLPRFIDKETDCTWCRKLMPILEVKINTEGIEAWYECYNDNCDSLKYLKRRNLYGENLPKKFIKILEEYQESYE